MKQAKDLSCDEIVDLVQSVQTYLYLDLDEQSHEFWNPEKSWSGDEFDFIAQVLSKHGLVPTKPAEQPELCECQQPGHFCSGVPGILAPIENCRLMLGGKVERCDKCQRYSSDQTAYDKLVELGMV